MANLEAILAETSKTYDNSRKALNDQINAISGDLDAQKQRINAQYAQQSKNLDRQRNWQAQDASMAAAYRGAGFGGQAQLANDKYYQRQFVPAITQMNTNQANDISSAESQANQHMRSLEQALASLDDEARRYGMQRYDAAVQAEEEKRRWEAEQAEKKRQFDAQMAQQRAYQNYLNAANTSSNSSRGKSWDFGNGYQLYSSPSGTAYYTKNGRTVSAGEFLEGTGANGVNWNLWNDVWNNGVSTSGIGGDTVGAFNRRTPASEAYRYLWG